MASKKVIGNTDFLWNQAERFSLERRAESPEIKQAGGLYFNTKDNCPYYCDGKKWKPIASDSQVDLSSVEPLLVRANDYEGVSVDYETILTAYLCGRTVLLMDESEEYLALNMIYVASGIRSFNEPGSTDGSWTNRITFTNTAMLSEQYSDGQETGESLLTFWVAEIAYTEGTETNGVPTPNHTALIHHQYKVMKEYNANEEKQLPPCLNIIYFNGEVRNSITCKDVYDAWMNGIPIYLTEYTSDPGYEGVQPWGSTNFGTMVHLNEFSYQWDMTGYVLCGNTQEDNTGHYYQYYAFIGRSSVSGNSALNIKKYKYPEE